MHYALVFSTSKLPAIISSPAGDHDASVWLADLAHFYEFLHPDANAHWLDAGRAAEVMCHPDTTFAAAYINDDVAFQTLRDAASAYHLDVNIVPVLGRKKKLLIADMDSTIITSESLDDLAELAGIGDAVSCITQRSMSGAIDFEDALLKRVAMLHDHPSQLFDTLVAEAKLTSGAIALVQTMRANDAQCYLISGGFDFMTGPVAALCGFHGHHANRMHVRDGKILGTVELPVLDRRAKAIYLTHYCKTHGLDASEAASIGDGANDLEMLQAAGMGVAFGGTPFLRDTITIQLNHTDLRGLLYLQGYKRGDFICGSEKHLNK